MIIRGPLNLSSFFKSINMILPMIHILWQKAPVVALKLKFIIIAMFFKQLCYFIPLIEICNVHNGISTLIIRFTTTFKSCEICRNVSLAKNQFEGIKLITFDCSKDCILQLFMRLHKGRVSKIQNAADNIISANERAPV